MLSPSENDQLVNYLGSLKDSTKSRVTKKGLTVYSVNGHEYAFLETGRHLLRLSLRSDYELGMLLREKYEEVSGGVKLNPERWITIVVSGQLSLIELKALVDRSYNIALMEN